MHKVIRLFLLALSVLWLGACSGTTPTAAPTAEATTEATEAATAEATAEETREIVAGPVNPTPSPTRSVVEPDDRNIDNIGGTPIAMPTFVPPPSYEELLAQYPDLQPYLAEIENVLVGDWDFGQLYEHVLQIYNEHGMSGVAIFLEEFGILERLGIPLGYLELLTAYGDGGIAAVEAMARARQIVNENNELSAYLAIDAEANVPTVTTALQGLGVTVYDYVPNTSELEIGIPLDILSQYQTPGTALDYLVSIAQTPHVVGFRLPTPVQSDSFNMQEDFESVGGETIGADAWNAAGFTGEGVRVGILDLGFGGIEEQLGENLPEEVVANRSLDRLNRQGVDHGTACAMIVHRVAPEAELFIAYYDGSYSQFMDALEFLEENDVQIVNHSVGSPVGPRDGSWGDSLIVDEFVRETGVLWVNAAGNASESYTAWDFDEGDDDLHDFGNDDYHMPFMAGTFFTSIIMNWDGNWEGREDSNYILTIYDEDGDELATAAEPRRGRRNDFPYQAVWLETNPGDVYYLSVQRVRGDEDNFFEIFIYNSLLPDWAQVHEHNVLVPADADASFTVGATGLTEDELESYSSVGPTMDDRIKPDISAPTGEELPGYREGFFGTSGAAPLVAGAAALVLQRFPEMTAPEIRAYLTDNAVDLGDDGEDPEFGAGRLALPAPDGAEEAPDSTEPAATVTDYDVDFNVRSDGRRGIRFTLSFELENFEGREVWAAVMFLDEDGEPLEPVDEDFQIGDTIGVGDAIRVRSGRTEFEDVTLFIPYRAFGDIEDDTILTYHVGILDLSGEEVVILWESEGEQIEFGDD